MEQLADTHTYTLRWRSFELRPADAPPLPPEVKAKILNGRPQFEAMARERFGVEINAGPFGFDSRPALIGEKIADAHGMMNAYHDAVMAAYWQEAADIGRIETLTQIAGSVGLDPSAFTTALDDPAHSAAVDADIQFARTNGLNGVPALVFNQQYLVSGAQPADALRQVIDKIQDHATG